MLYQEIKKCRICGNDKLLPIIELGDMALTGVFPMPGEDVEAGPLSLVKCEDDENGNACGLVQLKHDYDMKKLYGENYGYRSGLNKSMVQNLYGIVEQIEHTLELKDGDLVIDIASNDGTLLGAYKNHNLTLVGIDPTSAKFKTHYASHIQTVPDFFSADIIKTKFGGKKAKAISSISMFYDLPEPLEIMQQIHDILADDGIWVVEQSYMPKMIDNVSYDTICHEHLEYYSLKQFKWMADRVGLKIIDIQFNDVNGASFRITFAKQDATYQEKNKLVDDILKEEQEGGFSSMEIYQKFSNDVVKHKEDLFRFFEQAKADGKKIFGYGASTKGNVILQFCNITTAQMPYIAEVNEYKFGRLTPGTLIPILSEQEVKELKPDYFMVLPWHFKSNIIKREQDFIQAGGKLVFPLPEIKIV